MFGRYPFARLRSFNSRTPALPSRTGYCRKLFTADTLSRTQLDSLVQSGAHALRDDGWILVQFEHHRALESLRPGNQDSNAASEWVRRYPGFVRRRNVLAASFNRRFDALASQG